MHLGEGLYCPEQVHEHLHGGFYVVLPLDKEHSLESAIRLAAAAFETTGLHFGHGTSTAIDESSWLILYAMGLSPAEPPDYTRILSETDVQSCNELLERRISERVPAAYLTGQAWFAGLAFKSDKRALVPRSPLAEFITDNFFGLLDSLETPNILDLCTGGGCIAIACAKLYPAACVDASDLSNDALALAAENVEYHGMQRRVRLAHGSLFDAVDGRYDLIISNPPYVDAADIEAMPTEFSHEPMMGLAAGDDGLDLVRLMLRDAATYLTDGGFLVVEVGNSGEALEAVFPAVEFGWLQFSQGGHGVFVLSRQELVEAAGSFS